MKSPENRGPYCVDSWQEGLFHSDYVIPASVNKVCTTKKSKVWGFFLRRRKSIIRNMATPEEVLLMLMFRRVVNIDMLVFLLTNTVTL